jgi:hypothetical protein
LNYGKLKGNRDDIAAMSGALFTSKGADQSGKPAVSMQMNGQEPQKAWEELTGRGIHSKEAISLLF